MPTPWPPISFLANYPFNGTELVYCDPPYLGRTSSRRYRFDYTKQDHLELLVYTFSHAEYSDMDSHKRNFGLPKGWCGMG